MSATFGHFEIANANVCGNFELHDVLTDFGQYDLLLNLAEVSREHATLFGCNDGTIGVAFWCGDHWQVITENRDSRPRVSYLRKINAAQRIKALENVLPREWKKNGVNVRRSWTDSNGVK